MANHVTGTRLVADVLHAGGVNYSFGAVRPDTVQLHELLDSVDTTSSEAASVLQAIGVWKSGRGLACVVASATLTFGVVLGARRHRRVGRPNTLRAGVLEMEESLYCGSKGDSSEQSPPVADRSWSSGSSAEVEVSMV